MRFLLDANVWMESIRSRPLEADVIALLNVVPPANILLTDFALNSIGLVMLRHKVLDSFPRFIAQARIGQSIEVVRLMQSDLTRVVTECRQQGLDFDDAYQYVAAELHGLKIVSFDTDFDHTTDGRLTPAQAMAAFRP